MINPLPRRITRSLMCFLILALPFPASYAAKPERHAYEDDILKFTITPRTAQQIAAFYEGRGFPAEAIAVTQSACFFTIGIHNKSHDILWLDTANWHFQTANGPIQPISRQEWKQRWQQMGLELAYQSTFRWTLLPANLDFQADEREGGNITLPRTDKTFSLKASFARGKDKTGMPAVVHIPSLRCAGEPS